MIQLVRLMKIQKNGLSYSRAAAWPENSLLPVILELTATHRATQEFLQMPGEGASSVQVPPSRGSISWLGFIRS